MATPVRVGVVGVGIMGERHARVYAHMPNAELIGVYDPDRSRTCDVASSYGCEAMSMDELLLMVDAVSIAAPTSLHRDIALAFLERGRHVLIEKPLAGSLDEAHQIFEAAGQRKGQVVMVGHIERFNPTVQAFQAALFGQQMRELTFRRTSPFDQRSLDSDIVYDLMIHDIDLALDLVGEEIDTIDATGAAVVTDRIDRAEASLVVKGGLPVTFVASRVAEEKVRAIEVRTDGSLIVADLLGKTVTVSPLNGSGGTPSSFPVATDEPLRLELEHFVRCVIDGAEPLVGVGAGYRSMVMATTISSLIRRTMASHADTRLVAAAD